MSPKIEGHAPLRSTPPATRGAPAHAIDVATVDPSDVAALPRAYRTAISEAKSFAKKLPPSTKILVTPSASNGGEPVTVIVPAGAKEPVRVHTHYHGDRAGSVSGENAAADEIARRINAGNKTVYVMPEARAREPYTSWNNVKDINRTTDEALASAGLGEVEHTTISGHSAGGRALVASIKGQKIRADELVIQDALYEGVKGPGAYSALRRHLPGASAGVKTITIVPGRGTAHAETRAKQLATDLRAASRSVTLAPTAKSHAAAAGVLHASRAQVDTFQR